MGGRITATPNPASRATSKFFLGSDADTERRLRRALQQFGFGDALPAADRPLFAKKVIMLGRPPHRIDLIAEIDGVSFDEAWQTRVVDFLDGLEVSFISRELLLKNKLAAGRDKDLADARTLERLITADNEDR